MDSVFGNQARTGVHLGAVSLLKGFVLLRCEVPCVKCYC